MQAILTFTIITLFCLSANIYVADACWSKFLDATSNIEFHVYNRQKSTPDIITYGDELTLLFSSFKKKPGTIIYIHGWLGSGNTEGGQMIRDAYLKFADCNVILVDWNNAAYRIYTTSYASIERIGNRVAQMINWLIKKNLIDITDLHIIGFSLGAHVAGFTGKALAPLKVRRITGLDPAAPGFEWSPADRRLDESDAEFVDVIHTETRFAGTWQPIGHADFYPNWGHDQKGCIFMDLPCSHQMANKFYAESISNPQSFVGLRCDLYVYIRMFENCRREGNTFMGHGANPRVHGVFYVDS